MSDLQGILAVLSGVSLAASAPFVPALSELLHQRDAGELHIAQDYVKDPRFFAKSFRKKIEPLVAQADGQTLPYKTQIKLRKAEDFLVDRELTLVSKTGYRGIAVSLGNANFANDSGSHDLWIRGDAQIGDRFRCWTMAVDGNLTLGEKCRITRWIDAGATAIIGAGTQLGQSASSAELMLLGSGVKFHRMYGQPIVVESPAEPTPESANAGGDDEPFEDIDPLIDDHAFTDGNGLCFPHGCTIDNDVITRGDMRIGSGSIVRATLKAHGKITLLSGATVFGNVISRGAIEIGDDCTIMGNVFAEGDVSLGKSIIVGTADLHKSVYCAGNMVLGQGVRIHGAVIAERGGTVA